MTGADRLGAIEPQLGMPEHWDRSVDVAVVGLGCAGVCAAIDAAEAGAEVLAIEAAGAPGGTSALSGGLIYLGGGTSIQQACGFEDSVDAMADFLVAACGPGADQAKILRYCEGSVEHFEWLVNHGVPFAPRFCADPEREPRDDSGLVYSGGEDAAPYAALARPAPRGHHPQYPDSAGGFLMECLVSALTETTATVVTDATTRRLILDDDRVVGLVTRIDGRDESIEARRGVVLALGGFMFNHDMVARHCDQALRCSFPVGTDRDDGSGIRMGMGVGAATAAMSAFEVSLPIKPPAEMATGVLVNGGGQRFINEDAYNGRIGQVALLEHDGQAFMLFDEATNRTNAVGMRVEWVAETVEELAREIGVPAAALAATIRRYNELARAGRDDDFGKRPDYLVPLEPPIGAADLRVERAIYAPFTLGGLVTDVDGRVLDDDGEVVPGLLAAGRTTVGIAVGGYVSGISLGDGTFFGRAAGRAAAAGA